MHGVTAARCSFQAGRGGKELCFCPCRAAGSARANTQSALPAIWRLFFQESESGVKSSLCTADPPWSAVKLRHSEVSIASPAAFRGACAPWGAAEGAPCAPFPQAPSHPETKPQAPTLWLWKGKNSLKNSVRAALCTHAGRCCCPFVPGLPAHPQETFGELGGACWGPRFWGKLLKLPA